MKVKVSQQMTKALNNTLSDTGYKFSLVKINEDAFRWYVDIDVYRHSADRDKNGQYKVIAVTYPADYYAADRYLTTAELNHIFRSNRFGVSDITFEQYAYEVLCAIEI